MERDGDGQLRECGSWVGLPGLDAGPVDHAWLDNGHGVLSCVAGHHHASAAVAACPFYLRHDVVAELPDSLRTRGDPPSPVLYRGSRYFKLTGLVRPENWHAWVADLPASHGLRPCRWSVFSSLAPDRVVAGYDPRDALRAVLAGPNSAPVDLLARLLAGLGDPGNVHGSIGLTGSVAIAPERISHAGDIDLLLYLPEGRRGEVEAVLRRLGGVFLDGLVAADDERLAVYRQSRLMAPVCQPTRRDLFWSRRRDVAWVGEQRFDLTWAHPHASVIDGLPYDLPPVGTYHGELWVREVTNQFPVHVVVDSRDEVTGLLITARGLQDSLKPGDCVIVKGSLHEAPDGKRFVSVDDAAGHQLDLRI